MIQKIGIIKWDSYYKMRQKTVIKNLLQSMAEVYYKVCQVLQSVKEVYYKVRQILKSVIDCFYISPSGITKCDRLLLQSASGITKCGSYYKMKRNIWWLVGKIHIITTNRGQLSAWLESCKTSQLYYQDKHLRTIEIIFLSFQLQLY